MYTFILSHPATICKIRLLTVYPKIRQRIPRPFSSLWYWHCWWWWQGSINGQSLFRQMKGCQIRSSIIWESTLTLWPLKIYPNIFLTIQTTFPLCCSRRISENPFPRFFWNSGWSVPYSCWKGPIFLWRKSPLCSVTAIAAIFTKLSENFISVLPGITLESPGRSRLADGLSLPQQNLS